MKAIATKLNKIRETIKHPERSERNDFGKYDYSTRDDIYEQVRLELIKHSVEWVPSMEVVSRTATGTETKSNKPEFHNHIRMEILYIDCESGESVTQVWHGENISADDKGMQAASTQAVRFALTSQFQLMDGAEFEHQHTAAAAQNHEVHREEAPPADPTEAIVTRLHDVGLSEDQVAWFGEWLLGMEGAADFEEIPEARLLAYWQRFEALSDKELAAKAMGYIEDAIAEAESEEAA